MYKCFSLIIAFSLAVLTMAGCGSDNSSSTAPAVTTASVAIKNAALPVGTQNTSYSTLLGASGGKAPYKWSIEAGKLPSGLFLTSDGNIVGAPTALGTFTVVFKVTDSSTPPLESQKALQVNVSNLVFTVGTDGTALYSDHCAFCHGALGSANQQHKDATVNLIKGAVAADTGGMGEFGPGGIFPLTDAQLALIVSAIAAPPVVTPTVPAAPTGLVATAGQLQNSVSWSPVAGASTYNLYWSTTTGVTTANGTKISAVNYPYTHTALTAGTPYYYIVTAQNATGESTASTQTTATPTATPVPPDGVALFNSKCASCHGGSIAAYNHKGSSALVIQTAIDSKIGSMGSASLKALTPAEVAAIAVAVQ